MSQNGLLKLLIRWRSFLWKGHQQANGGCCLVAWDKVQRPPDLGGLGIPNLQLMGWALQAQWLRFRKTDKDRSSNSLDILVHQHVVALFQIAVKTNIGNGRDTLFWKDRWILGCSVADLAPLVVAAVPTVTQNLRLVADALPNQNWTHDFQNGLFMVGFCELFQLVDTLVEFELSDEEDVHSWRLDGSGQYTAKSAYRALFNGVVTFEPWRRICKS